MKNQELFQDIIHNAPISRSRSVLDAYTFKFKNTVTGELMTATDWYISQDGEFVIELAEGRSKARHHSLGALFGSVMADLENLQPKQA